MSGDTTTKKRKGWTLGNATGNGSAVWVRWAVGAGVPVVIFFVAWVSMSIAGIQGSRFTRTEGQAMERRMIERDEALLQALQVHYAAPGHPVVIERVTGIREDIVEILERQKSMEAKLDLLLVGIQ